MKDSCLHIGDLDQIAKSYLITIIARKNMTVIISRKKILQRND